MQQSRSHEFSDVLFLFLEFIIRTEFTDENDILKNHWRQLDTNITKNNWTGKLDLHVREENWTQIFM